MYTAYLYVKSEKGEIKGFSNEDEPTKDGKNIKEMSRVQAFNHSIRIPTHAQTGETQGPGQHTPVMVTIDLDRAVAELYKALTLNQRIDEAKVYFFRSGAGPRANKTDEQFHNWFTVTIKDARIVGLELRKALAMGDANLPDLLDVVFSYYEIRWEDHDENKEASYAWKSKSGSK